MNVIKKESLVEPYARNETVHRLSWRYARGEHEASRPPCNGRTGELTAYARRLHAPVLWSVLVALLMISTFPAAAQNIGYLGKNRLEFAPVAPFLLPDATGTGIVDYQGGKEPTSQWRASLRFTGLEAGVSYVVVVKGRFGKSGSPEASALTPLCSFQADEEGLGGCFWYFRGLARLNVVQLRSEDANGDPVLEASRPNGPGSVVTVPNRFSPGGELPARNKSG